MKLIESLEVRSRGENVISLKLHVWWCRNSIRVEMRCGGRKDEGNSQRVDFRIISWKDNKSLRNNMFTCSPDVLAHESCDGIWVRIFFPSNFISLLEKGKCLHFTHNFFPVNMNTQFTWSDICDDFLPPSKPSLAFPPSTVCFSFHSNPDLESTEITR